MDTGLFDFIQSHCPKFNQDITRGLACRQMAGAQDYIDRIWRCAADGFPPGLEYLRSERCTPQESYLFASAKRNNRMSFEYTRSDIYLMKYFFRFNGEDLPPRHMYLPFVSEAGLITIMGSIFSISPVLADKAVSVSEDSIFIPLNRDRLTFRRSLHHFRIDGQRISENVVWSNIHHASKSANGPLTTRKTMTVNASLAHYLFCKYGLQRTFSQMAQAEVHAGYPEDINEDIYPPHEWHICSSMEARPAGMRDKFYVGTKVRIAIRKADYNTSVASLIAGFYYVADRFPERMNPEYLNDVRLWKTLLGHVIYASDEGEGRLLNKIDNHMTSLDGYIDGMVKGILAEDHITVHVLYDLFMHIIDTYSSRIADAGGSVASMYGKKLMVLRYVLIDIIKAVFGLMFALQGNTKKALTKNDITKAMQRFLKPILIIRINHKHGEVSSVSNPSDNMAFKVTSNVVLQSSMGAVGNNAKSIIIDSSRVLHASIAEVGQYNNLPKTEPTGRNRLSPHCQIDADGNILRNPDLADVIDAVQMQIRR